jgi:hypothetical protein
LMAALDVLDWLVGSASGVLVRRAWVWARDA